VCQKTVSIGTFYISGFYRNHVLQLKESIWRKD